MTESRRSFAAALRTRISVRPIRRRLRDLLIKPAVQVDQATFREDLARLYLRGEGIEIGALHRPLRVPRSARVRYVDVMSREQLLAAHSPAVYGNPKWLVEVDVIDDGARLDTFADASVDFVIANHFLEHVEDPIAALEHAMRVLRPGGIVFLTVPDARHTFDRLRERTTVDHLLRDHTEGPEVSRDAHYREWALVECLPDEQIETRVAEFERECARHHFHVWEIEGFLEFLRAIRLPAHLELAQAHLKEFVVILRREPIPERPAA